MMWLNGLLVNDGKIEASSAGITLGWGVFRTLGVSNGQPRFFTRHFERLREDALAAQLEFPFSQQLIFEALQATLRANAVENGLARLTLTQRGDGRWNRQNGVDFSIMTLETEASVAPMRVQLSPFRVEAHRPLAGVKTTSYLPSWWAWRHAKNGGFEEAILRDGRDFLSEGARSTLVWAKNGTLFTPSLATGCLRGVGRDLVLEWAKQTAIAVQEGQFEGEVATGADEIWLVAAASGARLVSAWHDETGLGSRSFPPNGELGSRFQKWWLKASE